MGREYELSLLEREYETDRASLVVVMGRRRVGKSTLLEQFAKDKPHVFFSGEPGGGREQLNHFVECALVTRSGPIESWMEAFALVVDQTPKSHSVLVMLDEYPWIQRSSPKLGEVVIKPKVYFC